MCGIAGWVDFQRDLKDQVAIAQKMTDTMALRGPDDEGLWVGEHAALGHRRLSIIDLEGGRQPMLSPETGPDGEPLAVLSYSGEVYNFTELREELVRLGHRFQTRSDTEVVLRSYLQWGLGFIERLNGIYAFAVWDSARQELFLVRDRLGVKPLFYYPLPNGVLFGSEPKAILANPAAARELTLDGLRDTLGFFRTPGQTPLRGMHEVKPGHLVKVGRDGLVEQKYWELQVREHTDDLPTTIATIRGLLDDIVARQLIADVPLCTLLSGGLDSSTITALAQRTLDANGGGKVKSFSVDFAEHGDNFRPGFLHTTPDAPFVADLARHAGTDHSNIVLDTKQIADAGVRKAVLRAWDLPYSDADHDPSIFLLFQAIRQHSTVALSGEVADEIFGGYRWNHDPRAVQADTFPWHGIADFPVGERAAQFLDPKLADQLQLTEYIAEQYQSAVNEVPRIPGEDPFERRMRVALYLNLTRWMPLLLDRKDRMSMAVGLEARVPFCDHRLIEYVFNTPWSMKVFDGNEKSLLRAAAKDVLPESIVERRKVPYPSAQDLSYDQAIRDDLGEIARRPEAPARPLLDLDAVEKHLATPLAEPYTMLQRLAYTEIPTRLNAWLEEYEVELAV
ncbi:asparagine synthase (glutamine-hydrolyzing) [Segniliparus rugosus]|uniref:asparagine synthase (glutamine-hydrolyzing) n=1 Tax=Segniliparus rugosus (strain ATCC BAA-974 / DSM 45345 / CCUG 50838 / CIP 108380 / JCM 13579 / CDC 945) TaxID=679197 RepID=E5XL35_SEGRC|nr:asparagine synthase (glutamine-hydrolyzing) [Segniliparus rugosus]EFV14903.1 asparagine synthase (glutamine-hydrolyzing) [Segniliparus rugosus ATCC BAA-974]